MAITMAENLKTTEKHYKLIGQFESACTSVSMNIAEGKGRNSWKEFVQFLYIARGSLYETVTLATIFQRKGWITKDQLSTLESHAMEIASMIKGLIKAISQSPPSSSS